VKLATFSAGGPPQPGLVTARGVVAIGDLAPSMRHVIEDFERLRPSLERRLGDEPVPGARLLAPIRPGKILCSTNLYASQADAHGQAAPLLMTLKSTESVAEQTHVVLPDTFEPWAFFPEAELGLVIKGPAAKQVSAANWRHAVFGYTCVVDVMARGGDTMFGRDYWVSKSDSLCPIGPWITTLDEVGDPNALRVQSWQNGFPAQSYSTADAQYTLGQQLEFITSVMTLYTGDVIACGTDPSGARAMQDGDQIEVEVDNVGRLAVVVAVAARVAA
jgi:2-keto-4-pentenoate hydratase/2-oxohepta-3-ene-1,7-dioic acid hydratase in catechol pathway